MQPPYIMHLINTYDLKRDTSHAPWNTDRPTSIADTRALSNGSRIPNLQEPRYTKSQTPANNRNPSSPLGLQLIRQPFNNRIWAPLFAN